MHNGDFVASRVRFSLLAARGPQARALGACVTGMVPPPARAAGPAGPGFTSLALAA